MVAPRQRAYKKEAIGMDSLKMQTLRWCNKRTDRDWPANYSVSIFAVYGRQWNFAQIRNCLTPGIMVAPRQNADEKEAMGKESLKI